MFTYQPNPSKRFEEQKTVNTVATPANVAVALYKLLKHLKPELVFDPSCGEGNLLKPWKCPKIGVEIDPRLAAIAGSNDITTWIGPFENYNHDIEAEIPNLILCNPPWNGHWSGSNYTEVFLRKIVALYGKTIPLVLLSPMGTRLNQRFKSKRWKWISENLTITSIISCPADLYPGVETHNEIILFNIKRVKPHYWLLDLLETES